MAGMPLRENSPTTTASCSPSIQSKSFLSFSDFISFHFSVQGNGFYTASKDRKIMHVDSEGNPAMLFEGHENVVNSLSQSIPEEIVSGSWDGTARIWDTATGKCKSILEGH
jgi:WD40 repeat protein